MGVGRPISIVRAVTPGNIPISREMQDDYSALFGLPAETVRIPVPRNPCALPPEQRVTQSNMALRNGPRKGGDYTLRPFSGFSSEDALQPSGLAGPVTLSFSVP